MKYLKVFENFQMNEGLNKDIMSFASDLEKYLKNAGFEVKYLQWSNQTGQAYEAEVEKIKKTDNVVSLSKRSVGRNNSLELIEMNFNPKNLQNIDKVVQKFTLTNFEGEVISNGEVSKKVSDATNPGDITKNENNKEKGEYIFFRSKSSSPRVVDVKDK